MRRLSVGAASALLVLFQASPAWAGGGATGGADPGGASTQVGSPGSGGGASGGSGGGDGGGGGCPGGYSSRSQPITDTNTGQTVVACDVFCGTTFVVTNIPCGGGGAAAPTITGADLARQAFARVQLARPVIGMSPEPDHLVVQLPTGLWVSSGWAPMAETASIPGLSSTVRVRPTSAVWRMGDGLTERCSSPGQAGGHSSCSHTYTRSSAGQPGNRYSVTLTVSYAASWAATDGTGGDLGTITSPPATIQVEVGEVQALNGGG